VRKMEQGGTAERSRAFGQKHDKEEIGGRRSVRSLIIEWRGGSSADKFHVMVEHLNLSGRPKKNRELAGLKTVQ